MLRGDPVLIKPVHVFGAEYQLDVGWTSRKVLHHLPTWFQSYWKAFEATAVLGTLVLASVEVYLLLNQAFLDLGLGVILGWIIWLEANRHFLVRFLDARGSGVLALSPKC